MMKNRKNNLYDSFINSLTQPTVVEEKLHMSIEQLLNTPDALLRNVHIDGVTLKNMILELSKHLK